MGRNLDKIEQLAEFLNGTLKGKQKKALLDELQQNSELSDMLDILKKMNELSPRNSKPVTFASKKLAKTLFQDFLKEQNLTQIQFGVQVFDSSLLPLPQGVRPASVDTRLLKYQVGEAVVELTIYPITIDSVELIGQIRNIEKNQKITVSAQALNKTFTTEVDEFGLFRFKRIDAGACRLLLAIKNKKESIIELTI